MATPVPRRGGGFDLTSILRTQVEAASPRVAHPAVDAIFDPDRDSKLAVRPP